MDHNDSLGDKARRGMDSAGDAISRGVDRVRDAFTDDDDQHYRSHHSSLGRTDSDYDRDRTGYQYGHTAGSNESYRGRGYDDVESDLRRDYSGDDFDSHRDYIRHGYERSSQRYTAGGLTGGSAGATGGDLGSYSGERSGVGGTGTGGTSDTTYTTGGASSGSVRTGDQASDPRLAGTDDPSAGDLVGEAAGGISGVLTGAALGSMGGPVGTIIGGIAGAVGGWWTGRAVSEAAAGYTEEDETYYRSHYDSNRRDDLDYDRARTGYQLGHIAGSNPDYQGRSFDEVETDLRGGWGDKEEDYTQVRDYARHGYERSSQRFRTGGSSSGSNASGAAGGAAAGSTGATRRDRDVGVGDDSGVGGAGGAGTTGGTMNDRSLGGTSGGVSSTQQAGEFGKSGPMGSGNYGQSGGV
ncbi:hypothetical protein BH23GEM5_BH23GEM5_30290 [soil metagenome]